MKPPPIIISRIRFEASLSWRSTDSTPIIAPIRLASTTARMVADMMALTALNRISENRMNRAVLSLGGSPTMTVSELQLSARMNSALTKRICQLRWLVVGVAAFRNARHSR